MLLHCTKIYKYIDFTYIGYDSFTAIFVYVRLFFCDNFDTCYICGILCLQKFLQFFFVMLPNILSKMDSVFFINLLSFN